MHTTYRKPSAFTLVEIMIIVAIIGLLAAIAIPNFVRAKQTADKNRCVLNLRTIAAAKELLTTRSPLLTSTNVVLLEDDLIIYGASNRQGGVLKCPAGGEYDWGTIATKPATCSLQDKGHELPK